MQIHNVFTQELTEHGVFPVAWDPENGSEFVEISAKFNQNLDELLDTVLLVAEVQELKADPNCSCHWYCC